MRTVIIGTPRRRTKVHPEDLPADSQFAYLRDCALIGDFGERDLSWLDMIDCTVRGNFSRCDFTGLESYQSDWSQATLPPRISSFSHDLFIGMMKQKIQTVGAHERGWLQFIVNELGTGVLSSWRTVLPAMKARTDFDAKRMASDGAAIFAQFPGILKRLQKESQWLASGDADDTRLPRVSLLVRGNGDTVLLPIDWSPEMRAAGVARDRWLLAREAEAFLERERGEPYKAFCKSIGPFAHFEAVPAAVVTPDSKWYFEGVE